MSAIRYRPRYWYLRIIAALIAGLFVIDWVYMLYHTIMGNQIYREANSYASAPLYFIAGSVWLYRGSLSDLVAKYKKTALNKDVSTDGAKYVPQIILVLPGPALLSNVCHDRNKVADGAK